MPKHHIEYYPGFPRAILDLGVRRNVFLALSPLYSPRRTFALDLHVLAMPPAFNLSQDQTLQLCIDGRSEDRSYMRRSGLVDRVGKRGRSSSITGGSEEPTSMPAGGKPAGRFTDISTRSSLANQIGTRTDPLLGNDLVSQGCPKADPAVVGRPVWDASTNPV